MKKPLVILLIAVLFLMCSVASAKKKRSSRRNKSATEKPAAVEESPPVEESPLDEESAPMEESAPDQSSEISADAEAGTEEEVIVDLDSLEEEEASPPQTVDDPHAGHGHPSHGATSTKLPKFKLFFDLLVEYEWETQLFQFTRDHAHVMLEAILTPWLSFRADIAFEPEFFEGIFQLGSVAEFRLGKVMVPFGQNEFHHLIGGRVDKEALFLPTVWGEYGAVFKHFVYDGDVVTFDYSLWVVNGFQDTTDSLGNPVPTRQGGSLTDNNQMKGVGLRPTLGIGRSVVLGTSWYLDAWDPKNENWMLLYGIDLELGYGLIPVKVLEDIRIRAEAAWAEIRLPTGQNPYHGLWAGDSYGILPNYGIRRAGYNLELSYRPIKILTLRYREGWLNDDSRVVNENDIFVHEPGVIVNVGPVQFSLVAQIIQRRYSNWEEHVKKNIKLGYPSGMSDDEKDSAAEEQFKKNTYEYSRLLLRVLYRY